MRLEQLSDISSDHFYVQIAQQTRLLDFTKMILSECESFRGLPPSNPKKPPYRIEGSKISLIELDGIKIEIEQVGCTLELSDRFLLNTQDTMTYAELRDFYDYLKRDTNGQPHQKHLFQ